MKCGGIALLFAALLTVAACSSKSSTPSPTPTASATETASVDYKADASALVDDLAAGKFADVESEFDVTMKSKLSVDQLESAWRTFQESEGAYKSHGSPDEVLTGEIRVERVPVTTANGTAEVRVSYHPDETIAGLFFLKAGVPAP